MGSLMGHLCHGGVVRAGVQHQPRVYVGPHCMQRRIDSAPTHHEGSPFESRPYDMTSVQGVTGADAGFLIS